MTKQHTPGPWHVEPAPNRVHFAVRNDGVHVVTGWREGAANARLIAAAPELLAALVAIVVNARLTPDQRMGGATDVYSVPTDDIDAARAAITKAEEG